MELPEVPDELVTRVQGCLRALPEVETTSDRYAYAFKIRRRVFAYLFAIENPIGELITMLSCRADPEERAALLAAGHPYFPSRSGQDRIGVVLDDTTDWREIGELVTESYRLLAPKKLADGVRFDG